MSRASFGQMPFIDDLQDVDTSTAPNDGDHLEWDNANSVWIAAAPSGGGGSNDEIKTHHMWVDKAKDKWVKNGHNHGKEMDKAPYVILNDCIVNGIYLSGEHDNKNVSLEFYVNGTGSGDKVYTYAPSSFRTRYEYGDISELTLSQGDLFRIKCGNVSSEQKKLEIWIDFRVTGHNVASGGT